MKPEIFVSLDIEATGPIPGPYSMISLGAAAFMRERPHHLSEFEVNIHELPGAKMDPGTQKFWNENPEAWKYANQDQRDPVVAMESFIKWAKNLRKEYDGTLTAVCYPAGFDWTFIYWYMVNFYGASPFGMSALDMKTYAMVKLNKPFRDTTKSVMPKSWFTNRPHTHKALDDAIEQGYLFMNMLKA